MDKIICLGKNYAEHAKEMGESQPAKPVIFLKPPSILKSARLNGETLNLTLPTDRGEVHHECEIVVLLKKGGYQMNLAQAESCIGAVTLGLDMTLREVQADLKKQGQPWAISKVFPDSAVVGPWKPVDGKPTYLEDTFTLAVDGTMRQQARGMQMTLKPAACVAYASKFFPLCEGDLLFTGTPEGVGPVKAGNLAVLKWGSLFYSVRWSAADESSP